MATPEGQIQNAICDYLALKRHFFWRNNSNPIWNKATNRPMTMPKYHMNGTPDIIVINGPFFIGLEVKTSKGRLSANQKEFKKKCDEQGAEYYVVRSIDDVKEIGL